MRRRGLGDDPTCALELSALPEPVEDSPVMSVLHELPSNTEPSLPQASAKAANRSMTSSTAPTKVRAAS